MAQHPIHYRLVKSLSIQADALHTAGAIQHGEAKPHESEDNSR